MAREQPISEQKPVETGQETAMSRIPTDAVGNPEFEKAQPSDTWNALVEINDGNAIEAEDTARQMYDNATKLRDKALASKPKPGTSVMEIQKNKAEYKARLNEMQNRVDFWSRVLSFPEAEKKQTSKADEESTPAVPAKQQTNDNLAKGRRLMQEKGTYYKEDSKLGDYLDFEDFALRMIANGRVKFVWKSDPNNSAIKGLAAHLGFAGNESERKRVFSILANADKGGLRPDEAAQELVEIYNSSNDNESIDTMQALDTILDIIRSYGGKTRDMMNAAIAAHANVAMDERGYDEDSQGNPVNPDGTLYAESVSSIDEITDEDFTDPTRSIALPKIPENVDNAIGANGKPVIIKKSIFEKVSKAHSFAADESRKILKEALYNPDIVGQSQPKSKKNNWIAIKIDDSSPIVVLEVNRNKHNVEIVGWYTLDNRNLERIKRQAEREDGELLILTPKGAAASLSTLPSDLSSERKDTNIFEESNIAPEKPVAEQITEQRKVVNTEPTEAQKEAGNYRMGHVKIDGMDVTIENPKGSIRRGTDADGKKWESEMHYDYGYIRGTKAVDNDHIDIFLSDNPETGNVFVVDQMNPKTGEFDESKVMYGFASEQDARDAYLSNYEKGWKGLGKITEVTREEFKKWIESSTRKTKPFSEYASVKVAEANKENTTDLSSESKINENNTETQEDNRTNNKSGKIEDYGEQISGARKDMLRDLAKSVQNTSLESLISLPFSKAFKKPNLRKAVEEGALRDKDAQFAQAAIAAFLSTKKPVAGTKDERRRQRWGEKTNVEKWAEKAYTGIKILQELFDADERVRDKVIEAAVADKYVGVAEAKAQQQRIGELNHREFNGTSYPLNLIALYNEVFDRLGYPAGQNTKIPVGRIVCSSTFDSYGLRGVNGEDWIYPSRSLKSFEDVVDELVYLIKVANADETADHPIENFKIRGINPKVETTGYRVLAAKNITTAIMKGNRFAVDEILPTREAALKRIEELKATGLECSEPLEKRETVGYEKYQISFAHPITREFIPLEKEYDSKEEAISAPQAEHEELNRLANEAIAAATKKSGESVEKSYFHITHYYDKGSDGKYHWYYGVALDDKYGPKKTAFNTMPFFLAERLSSREEAQKQIDANKERWESLVKDVVRQRSNFVYFSGDNETRNGEDYRNEKDVTAEEFANKFGFRGVQFGNWANQADRQAALNNAYDSFMDMSKIIGVSPKAMSLNGELGVAFGSRGSGAASAHYEPGEVVINLTKTRGAGSLAHEWWHALDNYFSRAANVKLGYVTSDKRLPMREEMRKAFNDLVDDVEKSDYHTRSMDKGSSYWGTREEETARLFAEWIADEMAKRGELNNFLAGRYDAEDSYARMGYVFYKAIQKLKPEGEMMTFEEFRKTPMALKGFSYPTRAELEILGKDVRNIFGEVQERTDEMTGNVALFQMVDKILSDNSPENRLAYEAVSQMLSNAGIPVELLSDQAMREMAINANALETVSSQNEYQQTVVSSASGAKIINNLDNLAKSLENEPKTKEKTFLGALAKALDAKKHGSNSQYATFEAKNGTVVTIRLANHNAATSTFDNHEENDGISIVVSARENNGITNDGKAHVTEFYYDAIKLRKADGKPLVDIVKSIKQSLYSGEYKDTTGLAQREEVNAKDVPEFMTVYHGSGAKFDRFDHSHMGEGEGNQAFGWGTYVTEVEGIGRTYAKAAAKYDGKQPKRNLYTVEIPENNGDNYLDWSKKINDIGEDFLTGIDNKLYNEEGWHRVESGGLTRFTKGEKTIVLNPNATVADVYEELSVGLGSPKSASEFLNSLGYIGISYPAEYMSGGRSDGARNYVIFNENDAKITGRIEFLREPDGTVYGATVGGKIYLNQEHLNPNTPIHEYTHLWFSALKDANPELYKRGVVLMKQLPIWEEVKTDPNYANLSGDDAIASECLSRLVGDKGADKLTELAKKAMVRGDIIGTANRISLIEDFKDWLKKFWTWVKDSFAPWTKEEASRVSVDDIQNMVLSDLAKGVNPLADARGESELKKTNDKFNEQLETFTVETADRYNFNLGRPSSVLLSAGIENKPIRLHGSKVAKKIRKHGFQAIELRDLPKAIAHPIAVFDNLGREGNRSILTELKTDNGNVLVSIDLGRGTEVDFNIVSSAFGKKSKGILGWINGGKMKFVDKEKALNYLHLSAPIAEASDNAELLSAAKIVKEFENPSDKGRKPEFQFIGEKGAAHMDKVEEATIRLDNLSIARQMEDADKDAKTIKLATGWERGADGKWRYEISDANIKDTIDLGKGISEKRFEEDMLWNSGRLGDVIDAPEIFEAYPQLKDIHIETDSIVNDMPSNGEFNANSNRITIHADRLKYLNSVLNHEIQHAIQHIEGFATGGTPEHVEKEFNAAKTEWRARAYAHELEETAKELGGEYNLTEVENALGKEYKELGMEALLPDKETRIKGANYFVRGYADRSMDEAIRRFRLDESTRSDFNSYIEYMHIAGEVEARNVSARLGMTPDERRRTLALETEDVSREDQIILNDALNGDSHYEEELEIDRIVREAKENGTYMKAPNGKPTNLNERQWAQVRTRAFKKWFGDWEKAARIEKLRRSEPVIISGQEHEGKYELNRESAKAWMKDNLRGSYENEDTKTVITIGRKGVNKVTSHSMGSEAHLKSIAAIPEMLKKAIFITREQATKAGAQYPEYEYYVVGIKIGDVDYTAKVTIGVDENGNKFYDHALTEIEKGKLLDQKNGQAAIPGFISTEINPSVTKGKDTKLFSILQTNSSKIVDENGEPKVVYHGSPYRFFRFDKTKLGQSTGADSAKEGFFFTDNKELAELFSRYSLEKLPVSDVERLVKDRLLNMSEDELNDAYEVYRNDSPDYLDYADETDSPNDRDYLEISGFLLDGVSEEDAKRKYIQDSIESKIEGGYFSDMEEIEEELSSIGIEFGNNEQVFLNIESPVVDEVERDYFHNGEDVSPMTPVLQNAKRTGRDGVVFTGIVESGQKGAANQYVAFEPNQIKSATDNVGTFDGEQDDIRYRDSDRMDAEYMSAIEAGDMRTAGRMVEAAFRKAFPGSKVKNVVYHGVAVSEDGRQFPYNSIRDGHFTDDEGFAEYYAGADGYVYKVFLDIESPLEQDFRGQNSDYAKDSQGNDVSTRTFARRARESNGKYDGAIISNVDEYGNGIVDDSTGNYEGTVTDYIPVRPEQVYSAEPVVYDDNGQVIPLSRRFENGNPDIRYKHDETGNGSRTSQDVEAAATKLAESLGEKVRIVRDVNEIEHRNKKVQENQRKSKGWFNTDTREIVVVLPNTTGIEDVQATILHEAVGHKGLRELVGDDRFDDFLDKVYAAASLETRKKIVDLAKQNHWNFRLATEEYIAGLAENGFAGRENRTLFEKIKDFFRDMLSRAKIALGVNIGDNELRYMLWRTYQMRTSRGVLAKAEDISMQQAMKVGNFRNEVPEEASGIRFRNSSNGSRKNLARDIYEEKTRIVDKKGQKTDTANLMRRLKEAYVDSMQSLKYLQDAVAEETGKPVEDFENAYLAENAMSSKNKAQTDIYLNKFFNPIKDAIRELQKKGVEYNDIVRYLMAKHGLERNVVFSKRDAQRAGAVWDGIVRRDYSGLTELTRQENDTSTPSIQEITSRANEIVNNFEKEYYVDELWSAINNATKETLRTSYVDGLLTKDNYEMVRSMFDYYIPLRGWNENVASVEYDYLSDSRPKTSKIVKAATGRTTISDDPIATIAYMGQSAIIQGNRNMMKQKLLNLALNHKTGLLTVNRQWEIQDPVTGEWITRNPVIPVDATPEEVADIVSQFETDMKAAEKNGTARISRGKLDTGKHITAYEGQEHVVKVKRGGIEYCIYLNGNPRAAQAVNGMTNPDAVDSWLIRKARGLKNILARMLTSQNPTFIISNLSRDVIFAGAAVYVKEDAKYAARYAKNITTALAKGQLIDLIHRFETDRLDNSKDLDRYFGEFIRNGGETGFTQLNTVDDFKRDIDRFAREMKQGQVMKVPTKVWNGIWDGVELMNRCAEDVTRFSAYMTSRQMGRSVERSISDAKEITVNFNRKGSGGFGARLMNFAYVFFNASVQSLANAGKMIYEHPVKVTTILSSFSAAGFLAPLLAQAIISAFGGDDDAYWDLPEWVRRNNFVFYIPWSDNKFLIIPISQELRPFYAMGEIAMSVLMGKEEVLDGLKSAAGSFMDLLPIDFMGNGGNLAISLTPTVAQPFAQLVANSDYFGKPIYRRNDYNRLDPAWTKAYKGTSSMLINASKWLNEVTGGDDVKRGWIDPVNNPAVIEHLFESYLGGVGKTINKTAKTISMIWNPEMRDIRNVPIVSTFVQESDDERVAGSQLNREYVKAMEEFRETEHTISGYKRKARMGSMEYADKLSDFMNTPEFKKYSKMKGYASSIAKLRTALKKTEELNGDVMDAEYLQEMLRELKQQMLEELKED